MYINMDKILMTKQCPIKAEFDVLRENNSVVNRLAFMQYFRTQSNAVILENLKYMHVVPKHGPEFMTHFLKAHAIPVSELKNQKSLLENTIESLSKEGHAGDDHVGDLKATVEAIESIIIERSSNEYLYHETVMNFKTKRIIENCLFESYMADDMDGIINNINFNPETIAVYEKILREIKLTKSQAMMSSFPALLSKNTDLVIAIKISSIGSGLPLVASLPNAVVNKLEDFKVSPSQAKAYKKILEVQISRIYKELKTGENSKYNIYTTYLNELKHSHGRLDKYIVSSVEESYSEVNESIATMQPEIVAHERGVLDDFTGDLEDILSDIVFDEEDEISDDVLEQLARVYVAFESLNQRSSGIVLEDGKIGKGLVKAAHSVEKGSKNIVSNMAKAGSAIKRVATPINKSVDPFINGVNKILDNIKKMDIDERRNRIITGQLRFKLTNTLSKAIIGISVGKIILGGAGAVPIVGLITALTALAIDKKLDDRQRRKILADLEGELKIVNEKIEDSRSDSSREKKYQLMRIKQKLEKDIDRIKYRLGGTQ